jgi:quinol monooxygenase YgiN
MPAGYGLIVRFTVHDSDAAAAFDALVAETAVGIEALEPGTLVYVSHQPEGEPLVRLFYELYADRAAFEVHEAQPHTRRFLELREQHLAHVDVTFIHELAGKRPAPQENP